MTSANAATSATRAARRRYIGISPMIRNIVATKPAACTLGSPPPPVKRPCTAVWLTTSVDACRPPVSSPMITDTTDPATNASAT